MREVDFKICLTASGKVTVVFDLVRFIVFDAFRSLSSVCECSIFLFLAILTLGDTRIYIGSKMVAMWLPTLKQ